MPTDWCISLISPLPKGRGSKNDPNNYRGISLISCIGKLFTALINDRLTKFAEMNNIIGEEQAGFRSGYSTHDHIFTLHSIIDLYLNKFGSSKKLYCAFVDYQKAFDLVDRSSLWLKLIGYNINGKIMKLIYNLYQNTKACVKLNNYISNSFTCNIGVRQGDNLSPLLFSLFINDFETFLSRNYNGLQCIETLWNNVAVNEIEVFLKLYVLLYADDTIIMAESPEELQDALNALGIYCHKWHLKINVDKTKIIKFQKRRSNVTPPEFVLNGQKVELVDNYVYLGTTFSYNGKFNEAINKQIIQANRALFVIKAKKDMFNLPMDIMLDLFDKMIIPIVLYGCEVWGFGNIECIEIFYRRFLKYLLKVNSRTPNCMVYGETGRTPLSIKIKLRMVCFWHRVSTGGTNKLSFKFLNLLNMCANQRENTQLHVSSAWLNHIKQTLTTCGMGEVWQNPELYKLTSVKKILNTKLTEIFNNKWHNELTVKSSCVVYRSIKVKFEMERYLTMLECSDRINICKFRCRNTKIPVVIQGYHNIAIPYEERLCTLCSANEIGDEFHYILQCPVLARHRNACIDNYYVRNPSMYKLVKLFQSHDVRVQTNLAKLIKEINKVLR